MARKVRPGEESALPATHVALWRGINIGKAKRIAMADLRSTLEGLGFRGVRTLLNSGNAVFAAPAAASEELARRIQEAVSERTGVSSRVTVLSARELHQAMAADPLRAAQRDPSRVYVAVLANAAAREKLEPLLERDWSPGALALGQRVAYLWSPWGVLESPLVQAVQGALGDAVTTRTWATLLKLDALAASGAPSAG